MTVVLRQRARVALAALVALGLGSGSGPDPDIRSWRSPTEAELDQTWRKHSKERYVVARGDFDGDGKPDEARIMLSVDGKRAALVVNLSTSGRKVLHEEQSAEFVLAVMGIEVLRSGHHRTACGKGYFECSPGEPGVLVTRWDSIDYFKYESVDSVFCIPVRGEAFRRVWLSD